jgi:arabinogalactan endo-1,4-beta-galactosidase
MHSGAFAATQWKASSYLVSTYQTITNLPSATYTLSAWVRSGGGQASSGGYADMNIRTGPGGTILCSQPIPTGSWTQISCTAAVSSGQATYEFTSSSPANDWIQFDDVTFHS